MTLPGPYNLKFERQAPVNRDLLASVYHQAGLELSGRGWVADQAERLKSLYEQSPAVGTGTGTIATAPGGTHGVLAAGSVGDAPKLLVNIGKDLIDLPAQAVPSAYMTAAALFEAAKGDRGRAKQLWKEFKDTDAWAALASGDVKEFGKRFAEHPLISTLEASGGKAIVGRGAGATMRSGVLGRRAQRAASTERAPLELYPPEWRGPGSPAPRRVREYPRDVIDKAVIVGLERRARRRGRDPDEAQTETMRPVGYAQRERELQARTDAEVALIESLRRGGRERAVSETARPLLFPELRGRAGMPARQRFRSRVVRTRVDQYAKAVPLIAANIVRRPDTVMDDLRAYRDMVADVDPKTLTNHELRSQRETLRDLDDLLLDEDFVRDPAPAFEAAERYTAAQDVRDTRSQQLGLLDENQAEAKSIPYAIVHMGARYNPRFEKVGARVDAETGREFGGKWRGAFVWDPDGNGERELTIPEVRDHMAGDNVSGAGHFTMRPRARGRGNFYVRFMQGNQRARIGSARRTGEAVRRGTWDMDPAVLVEQAARSQGLIDAAEGFDRMINEFAVRKPQVDKDGTVREGEGGWFRDFEEAENFASEVLNDPDTGMPRENGLEMVPVNLGQLSKAKLDVIRSTENLGDTALPDMLAGPEGKRPVDQLSQRMLDSLTSDAGTGRVALLPKVVLDRIQEHNIRLGTGMMAIQKVNQTFKETVLPTSTKWMFGNAVDIGLRSSFHGITPLNAAVVAQVLTRLRIPTTYGTGKRLINVWKSIDEKGANEFEQRTVQGAWFSSADKLAVYRDAEQFVGTGLEKIAKGMGAVRRAPGPNLIVDLWAGYKRIVFGFNKLLEVTPQYAAIGKLARRDVRMILRKQRLALDVSDDALADLARGLRNTPAQERYAAHVRDVFGSWSVMSPRMRKLLMFAPFALWARAATKFVYVTLPTKHPIKTGLLAAAYEMTERERELLGLSLFAEADVRKPGFLQGSIPRDDTGNKSNPFSGYTSFGIFSEFPESAADFALPQVSGVLNTMRGVDFKFDKLALPDGSEPDALQKFMYALYVQGEAFVPFMSHIRRVREGGGKTQFGSTAWSPKVKEGTRKGTGFAVERITNPLKPVERSPEKKAGGELDLDAIELDPEDIDVEELKRRLELAP